MSSSVSDPWTFAVAFIEMSFNDTKLATGSSFFWEHNRRTFLVTNWHNVTGRDQQSRQPMSQTGGIPNNITFSGYRPLSKPGADGLSELAIERVRVNLYGDSDGQSPVWLEHPTYGDAVDIAALDVTDKVAGLFVRHANEVESDAVIASHASQDAFIVGYPLGLIAKAPIPVWKRATIATEPAYEPDDMPKIYVDTATRKGMSGSVVVARHIVVMRSYTKKDGSESEPMLYSTVNTVLGIYSGRLGASNIEAQLGIVWKRHLIEETVRGAPMRL